MIHLWFNMLKRTGAVWIAMALIASCKKPSGTHETLFAKMENTGIQFINEVKNSKDFNIFSYRNFYNGGGVAIGDINNDSLPDVYFAANMGSNKLYINKGNWQFEDITDKAGVSSADKWSTGVVMADINADGLLDIYVCNAGFQEGIAQDNELYINNGNGTFTEQANAFGLADAGYTTHAAFFDYDRDGDLDCYMLNNSFIPVNTLNYSNKRELRAEDWPVADFLKGGGDKLLRNDNGRYIDVSEDAGIYGSLIGFGLGVTVGDLNGDLYPDIYVSNDFFERDYLYINQGNGTFKETLEKWTGHTSLSSMGADMADINNDGYPDLFVTDMLPDSDIRHKTTSSYDNYHTQELKEKLGFYHQYMQNTLQLNNRNGAFYEIAHYSGVSASDWSWGGLIFDADNDGFNDLYVCNGIYQDVTDQDFIDFFANDIIQKMVMTGKKEEVDEVISKMPSRAIANKAFRNKGNLQFEDAAKQWGFTEPSFSNGAAYGDLDGDGDLDLVVNNINQPAFIYRNNSDAADSNRILNLSLRGNKGNTYAIGAQVKIYQGDDIIARELIPTRGFQSSCDYKIVAGLHAMPVDSVEVVWPNGYISTLRNPGAVRHLYLQMPDTGMVYVPKIIKQLPLLDTLGSGMQPHIEDDYVDFYTERNIPQMLSREGPALAAADINGDGLEDVFVGGGTWQAGQIYVQTNSGFQLSTQPAFAIHAAFEDICATFFDANGDGSQDLIVGSGGNHLPAFSLEMQNRLYLNDGKGNFTLQNGALPANAGNTSVIAPFDWDEDGDIDVFVAARSKPQAYGEAPAHYFLQNNGKGIFTDITQKLWPEAGKTRMITAASWASLKPGEKPVLIITGDWMHPECWQFDGKKFQYKKTNLENYKGWWQSMLITDLDNDGLPDIVLGNMGKNYYLRPSDTADVKLWVHDFDGNAIMDKIITRQIAQKDVPVFLKREITDQLPSLKKQNLRHEAYAQKSFQELVGRDAASKAMFYSVNTGASLIAWNKGNYSFDILPLPDEVQFSSIRGIAAMDVNDDGQKDLVMGGNDYYFLPQFSRLDASYGHIVIQKGNHKLQWIEPKYSGIHIPGQIRKMVSLGKQRLLVSRNEMQPLIVQKRTSIQ